MAVTTDNPMGTDGFEFVEYTAPDSELLDDLFNKMGFVAVARHRSKRVVLYRQGDVNFIVNHEPESFAQAFAKVHGPSACAFAIRVADAGTVQVGCTTFWVMRDSPSGVSHPSRPMPMGWVITTAVSPSPGSGK